MVFLSSSASEKRAWLLRIDASDEGVPGSDNEVQRKRAEDPGFSIQGPIHATR